MSLLLLRSARFSVEVLASGDLVRKRALDPLGAARLATEAAALERLAGVQGVVERVAWDGFELVTRRVDGVRLGEWWQASTIDSRQRVARALTEVVATIHVHGVVHRDLAPDNLLIGPDDKPVLIDFELARFPGHAHGGGTPATAAPELRWLPDPRLADRRADVFSLGLLLGKLLFDAPWALTSESLAQRLRGRGPVAATPWLEAMTRVRRSDRLADVGRIVTVLGDSTTVLPGPMRGPRPAAL